MTCLEKYMSDHPHDIEVINGKALPDNCPGFYRYVDNPNWCTIEFRDCVRCWHQEIPETEEKENEDMTCTERKANGFTPKTTCSLNYEAEYERLLEVNKELNAELEKANRQREMDLFALRDMRNTIEKYEFGFHVVEAFLGRGIMNNLEDEF